MKYLTTSACLLEVNLYNSTDIFKVYKYSKVRRNFGLLIQFRGSLADISVHRLLQVNNV